MRLALWILAIAVAVLGAILVYRLPEFSDDPAFQLFLTFIFSLWTFCILVFVLGVVVNYVRTRRSSSPDAR